MKYSHVFMFLLLVSSTFGEQLHCDKNRKMLQTTTNHTALPVVAFSPEISNDWTSDNGDGGSDRVSRYSRDGRLVKREGKSGGRKRGGGD